MRKPRTPVPISPRDRKKPLPHKVRKIGGKHIPIVLFIIYHGFEVLWPATSDRQGNRRVYYQCFCGQAGRGRFTDLRNGVIKSCGCLSTANCKRIHHEFAEKMECEDRQEIFSLLSEKVSPWTIAALFHISKISVDFVRRFEYRRLERLDQGLKILIVQDARMNMETTQQNFMLTHAEVMGICTLESQRKAPDLAAAAAEVEVGVEPSDSIEGNAVDQAEWSAKSAGYREYGMEIREEAWIAAQVMCAGNNTDPVSEEDLLTPKALESIAEVEDTFRAVAPTTHPMFEGFSSKTLDICDSSRRRNKQWVLAAMRERSSEIHPLQRHEAVNKEKKRLWKAARRKAVAGKSREIGLSLTDMFLPSGTEIGALAETLNLMARANVNASGSAMDSPCHRTIDGVAVFNDVAVEH